jgi:predicted amidophosphoribosyltransferase
MLKCSSCGAENPAESRFCTECGAPLSTSGDGEAKCTHCGAALPAGAKFCVACGQPAGGEAGPAQCPACGAPLPADSQFCTRCGASLAGQSAGQATSPAMEAAAAAYLQQLHGRLAEAGFEKTGPVIGFDADPIFRRQRFELMMLNKVSAFCAIRRLVGPAASDFVRGYSQALCRYGETERTGLGRLTGQPLVVYPLIVADACPPDTRAFLEGYWPKHFLVFEFPLVVVPGTKELHCHRATPVWAMANHGSILKEALALFTP